MQKSSPTPINCFLGMFDIIGFKELRKQRGTSGLHQKYNRGILPAILHSIAGKWKKENIDGEEVLVPDFSGTKLKHIVISDSVLFFTPDDSFASFVEIVNSAFMLLQFGFGAQPPFRGAIGYGDLIYDPQGIIVGSAIEDAYEWEAKQVWAGAMLTPASKEIAMSRDYIRRYAPFHEDIAKNITDQHKKETILQNAKRLLPYRVPTQMNPKDGPVQYQELDTFAINWTIRMFEDASEKSFSKPMSRHAETIVANTRKFETWARAQ